MEKFKFNAAEMTLTITKAFEEAMADPTSEEYAYVGKMKRDFPNLKIKHRTHNRPKKYTTRTGEVVKNNKNKGLTYAKMEKFISTFSNSEELMEQYNYIKANALNPYPAVAGWFEFQFPHFRKNPLFYLNEKVVVLNGSDYLTYLAAVA